MPQREEANAMSVLCDAAEKAGFEVLVSAHGALPDRFLRVELLDKEKSVVDFERVAATADTPEAAAERLLKRRKTHGL